MSALHPDLAPWIEGSGRSGDGRAVEAHLRVCAGCRLKVAQEDPSLLFRLLALEAVPQGVLDRVSTRATAAIAREVESRSGRRSASWAAVAASFLLAFCFGAYLWDSSAVGVGASSSPKPVNSAGIEQRRAVVPASMFEVLESPGEADVFEFSLDGDVQIAMIFDTELDI